MPCSSLWTRPITRLKLYKTFISQILSEELQLIFQGYKRSKVVITEESAFSELAWFSWTIRVCEVQFSGSVND